MSELKLAMTVAVILFAVLMHSDCNASETTRRRVEIVRADQAEASIVIASNPTPAAQLAALELQTCFREITGVTVPIRADNDDLEGATILVGESALTRTMGLSSDKLGEHEYLIELRERAIVLLGHDAPSSVGREINYAKVTDAKPSEIKVLLPGMYEQQGSLRAAYDFLERFCGVRFYGPKHYMVHFPKRPGDLTVTGTRIQREPTIKYTNGLSSDTGSSVGWPLQRGLYDNPTVEEVLLFARRLRTGGETWYVNHTFNHLQYKDRFFKKNPKRENIFEGHRPEFFPPTGSRSHQLCYTSPELAQQLARDGAAFFDNQLGDKQWGLDRFMGKSRFFPVVPNDVGGYCNCDRCKPMLKLGEGRKTAPFNSGETSDYVFNFANMVARELRKTHPDKYVGVLAYEQYFWKPTTIKLEPNVAAVPCLQVCMWWRDDTRNNEMKWYKAWVQDHKERGAPLFLWNYYHLPEEFGVGRNKKIFPHFSGRHIAELSKMYAQDGVEGVFLCGWGEGLDFYLTMKFFDDPSQNVDQVIDEYFVNSFGAAAKPMKAFYNLIEEISTSPSSYPQKRAALDLDIFWVYLGTDERLNRLESYMNEAKRLAATELEKRRVAVWDKAVMQYMRQGSRDYHENLAALKAKAPHDSTVAGYIDPVSVAAYNFDLTPYKLITGHQMIEAPAGVFGSREAKLDIRTDGERHWHGWRPTWVEFNLGELHKLDEIRIWNYQQNRGYGINRRGMRQIVIEVNDGNEIGGWRAIREMELPIADDREPCPPSAVIDCQGVRCRFVRIRAVGKKPGQYNWSIGKRKDSSTGLGQVRIYGQPADQ